jgi:8-oxo-dGTP diphosphatase
VQRIRLCDHKLAISPYIQSLREKIGHDPLLLPSVCALIFNDEDQVLLHRAFDDGLWRTIGGSIEPGEEPAEALIREVKEETGFDVSPERITGVYTRAPMLYPNNDVCLYISIAFRCKIISGDLMISDESLDLQFFSRNALPELIEMDRLIIEHGFVNREQTYFKL